MALTAEEEEEEEEESTGRWRVVGEEGKEGRLVGQDGEEVVFTVVG